MIDPAKAADKWAQAMGSAGQAYTDGINSVTVSPMQAAANNVQGYLNGVQAAVNSGKYAAGLNRVSLQQWKQQAISVGVGRLSSGAQAAKPKMQSFLVNFLPFLANVTAQTRAMPSATPEDRINRMVAQARGVMQYKRGG